MPRQRPESYGYHDRFTIPLGHPSAFKFYVDRLLVAHSRREMAWATAARVSSIAGRAVLRILGLKGVEPLGQRAPGAYAAVRRLCSLLAGKPGVSEGEPSVIAIDDYGDSNRGKVVAFILNPRDKAPSLVAKMSANPEHVATLEREHANLRSLRERLGEGLSSTLPMPFAVVSDGSRTAFAEQYMPGRSMYFEMRNSWAPRRHVERHFELACNWLIAFQKATQVGDGRLGDPGVHDIVTAPLAEYQRLFSPAAAEGEFIAGIIGKRQAFDGARLPVVANQGDFWARNLILQRAGLGVLDWESYSARGSPLFDIFLFATSYGLSYPWELGRWTEPAAAFRATYTANGWMARSVRRHLIDFCERAEVSPKLLEVCFPAFLAERAIDEVNHSVPHSASFEAEGASGDRARYEVSAKGQMWRRLFQEYARMAGSACFG